MSNALPEEVLEAARAAGLPVEAGEVLFSEEQGLEPFSTVCVDKWLTAKRGCVELEVRVLQRRDRFEEWDGVRAKPTRSDPLTKTQALQIIDHWRRVKNEARRLARYLEQQEQERLKPRTVPPWER